MNHTILVNYKTKMIGSSYLINFFGLLYVLQLFYGLLLSELNGMYYTLTLYQISIMFILFLIIKTFECKSFDEILSFYTKVLSILWLMYILI